MIVVKKEGVLLSKTLLGFENEGVLNPAVIQENGTIHLFYRAEKVLSESGNIRRIDHSNSILINKIV